MPDLTPLASRLDVQEDAQAARQGIDDGQLLRAEKRDVSPAHLPGGIGRKLAHEIRRRREDSRDHVGRGDIILVENRLE